MNTKQLITGIALVLLSSAALTEAARTQGTQAFRRGGRPEEEKGLGADRYGRRDYDAGEVEANRFDGAKDDFAFGKEFKGKEFKGEAACEDEHFKAAKSEKHSKGWDEGSCEEFVDAGKSAKVVKDSGAAKEEKVVDRDDRDRVDEGSLRERGVKGDYQRDDRLNEGDRRRGGDRYGRRFY